MHTLYIEWLINTLYMVYCMLIYKLYIVYE